MSPITLADLYQAKAARRERLASLPFVEKVLIMEKLQEMGHTLRAARSQISPRTSFIRNRPSSFAS